MFILQPCPERVFFCYIIYHNDLRFFTVVKFLVLWSPFLTFDLLIELLFLQLLAGSVVISGDGWFYDFGDSNRASNRAIVLFIRVISCDIVYI